MKKTPYDISLQNKIHLDKIYYIKNEYLKEYKKISEIFSKEMSNFLNKNHISEQKLFYEYSIHKKIDNNTGQINNICVLENNDFIICTKDKSLVISQPVIVTNFTLGFFTSSKIILLISRVNKLPSFCVFKLIFFLPLP